MGVQLISGASLRPSPSGSQAQRVSLLRRQRMPRVLAPRMAARVAASAAPPKRVLMYGVHPPPLPPYPMLSYGVSRAT